VEVNFTDADGTKDTATCGPVTPKALKDQGSAKQGRAGPDFETTSLAEGLVGNRRRGRAMWRANDENDTVYVEAQNLAHVQVHLCGTAAPGTLK